MDSDSLIKTVVVEPFLKTMVAKVELHHGWKLKTKISFYEFPPSIENQLKYSKEEVGKKNKEIVKLKELEGVDLVTFEYEEVETLLMSKSYKHFIDYDFLPVREGRALGFSLKQ